MKLPFRYQPGRQLKDHKFCCFVCHEPRQNNNSQSAKKIFQKKAGIITDARFYFLINQFLKK
jgi:hypothetical protein